jgi:putative MFS transporter
MSLFTMLFSEGSESIVLGLIIPVLVYEWNIDTFGKSMLITLVYVGVSLGSALQTVADHFGRYSIISLAAIIQTAAGLMSAIAGEFSFFLFMRFIYGIGIGIVLPLSATFVSEITPTAERARQLIYSRIIWNLGTILTCLLSYFLLDGFEEQASSWRLLLLIVCLPGVLALYFHFVHGRESPRYLLLKGKY